MLNRSRATRFLRLVLIASAAAMALPAALAAADGGGSADPASTLRKLQAQYAGQQRQYEEAQRAFAQAQQSSSRLAGQIDSLGAQETRLSATLYRTEAHLQLARAAARLTALRLARAQTVLSGDIAAVARYRAEAKRAQSDLSRQLAWWYEQGPSSYLSILLEATSFTDFLTRSEDMAVLVREQAVTLRRDAHVLAVARGLAAQAQAAARAAEQMQVQAADAQASVRQQAAAERALIAGVSAQKAQRMSARAQDITAMQRLASQISAIEEQRKALLREEAAAKAAEKAAQAGQASPPPANGGVVSNSAIVQDLATAAADAGVAQNWVPWLAQIVDYESGGDPNAVSSVAVDGEYASGLMQMLPDTFSRYALPGHTDIWNPVDNAIAAIRYIQANYGVPWQIPGIGSQSTYHGY